MKETSQASMADRNFDRHELSGISKWIDAFDQRFAIKGLAWVRHNRRERSFHRIPGAFCEGLTPGVRTLARCPAGVHLAFSTDTRDLAVEVELENTGAMSHMPLSGSAGVEAFFHTHGAWRPLATAMPRHGLIRYQGQLMRNATQERRNFRLYLYLPLYCGIKSLKMGFYRSLVPHRDPL